MAGLLDDVLDWMTSAKRAQQMQGLGNSIKEGLLGIQNAANVTNQAARDTLRTGQLRPNTPAQVALDNQMIEAGMNIGPGSIKFQYPQAQALETARQNAVKMLGLPENNTAIDRANAMPEFQKTLYQGMRGENVKGNWYANNLNSSDDYLASRPVAAEFRGPAVGLVSEDPSKTYGPVFTKDVADILGGKLGADLIKFTNGEAVSHKEMISYLKSVLGGGGQGEEAALDVYNKTKAKTKGFSGADITLLHPSTPVRYLTAAFDPARRSELDPLAAALMIPLGDQSLNNFGLGDKK